MGRSGASGWVLLAVTIVGAGCMGAKAGDAADRSQAAPVESESEPGLGGIVGLVTDTELVPVPEALVAVDASTDLVTSTDADGHYGLVDLAPGAHTFMVQKLGFRTAVRTVNVLSDDAARVDVQLERVPSIAPFITYIPLEGYLSLDVAGPAFSVPAGSYADPNDERLFVTELDPPLEAIVSALVWQPSGPSTSGRLRVELAVNGFSLNATAGPSPVLIRADQLPNGEPQELRQRVALATTWVGDGGAPVQAAFQQRFTIYTSLFYHQPAPLDYTGLPEG